MAQPKFVRVDDAGKITTPGVVQQMTDIAKANGVPAGGTTGQVLQRSPTGAATWGNAPSGLPSGGSAGQVVTRQADGTAAWAPAPKGDVGRGIKSIVSSTTDPTKATVTYTDNATEVITLPAGAAGKSIKSFGIPDPTTGVSTVTFSDDSTTTITLPKGPKGDAAVWSKDAQAKAQGYWIVVSPTEPESGTYTTADGTVVPVIWQKPIERVVPVLPQAPAFSRASSSLSVPDLVGVVYRITGWSKDNGATWTAMSKDLVGGAVTDVKTATGQVLPLTVRVEAFAKPGYMLPTSAAYKWTFDYPDPNATVILTSDTFAVDVADIHTRMSDAALGGTAKQWVGPWSGTPPLAVVGGKLTGAGQGFAYLTVGAFNQEVEFDLSFAAGVKDLPNDSLALFIGSTGKWNGGAWVLPRFAPPGHYKASIVGSTLRVTLPNGTVTTTTDIARTTDQVHVSVQAWSIAGNKAFLDNLIVRQVGY